MLLSSEMRMRWRLILFGVFAATTFAVAFWPKPPDEFAFLNKYHPVRKWERDHFRLGTTGWALTFTFPKASPELFAELKIQPLDLSPRGFFLAGVRLKNGKSGFFDYSENKLNIFVSEPSWFLLQWEALKRALGLDR